MDVGDAALPQTTPASPPFRARLTWDGETLKVELFSHENEQLVAESNVRFSETDDEQQRWIAAGLLVASLAAAQASGELTAPLVQEPPPPPKEPPKPVVKPTPPPKKPAPEPPAPERLRLDWSIFAAPGFDEGPLRVGFGAAGEFLTRSVPVGPRLSLRFADAAPDEWGAELSSVSGTVGFVTCLTSCHGTDILEVSA